MADQWPAEFGNQAYNNTETANSRINSVRFGDGYEQRVPDGINFLFAKLDLTFRRRKDVGEQLFAWLKERVNYTSILLDFPDATPGQYICRSVSKTWSGPNDMNITASFEQDFSIG